MRVIPPLAITDAMLTSSTATEPGTGETAYNAGTTYAVGDTCSVITTNSHLVYTSLQAGNVGHTPASSPTWWFSGTPPTLTNRWKMFDLLRNTATVQASPLTVVLTPGVRVNSLSMTGIHADQAAVSVTSGGVTVYTNTINLITRIIDEWYTYFFEPFTWQTDLLLTNLPPYTNAIITVALTISSGNVSCGGLVIGNSEYLGAAQLNAKSDTINFSTVTRDAFGNATMNQQRNIPKTTQTMFVDKGYIPRIAALRDSLNSLPAIYSILDDNTDGYFEAFFVLGFYRTFTINAEGTSYATINLEIEEI